MTIVRIRGFQIFRDRLGVLRCYHRATRTAIDLTRYPLGSAEFMGECQRILDLAQHAQVERVGTLGKLIRQYREHTDFQDLATRTRSDYQGVFDYLRPIADTPLVKFTPPLIVGIRDKAAKARGRRFGTYVKQVLSALFSWGIEHGHMTSNPAFRIKGVKKPKGAPEANRPWTDTERAVVLEALPPHMLLPFALMMFVGLDPQDAVALPKTAVVDEHIDMRRGKTDEALWAPLPEPVKAILASSPKHDAITLCANSGGRPWARSVSGLRASWGPIRQRLEREGKIGLGLTLKGLRHGVATILAEMGYDERTIADMLAQKTTAMARHYSRRANKRKKLAAVITNLDAELRARRGSA